MDALARAKPSQAQRDFIEENWRRGQNGEPLLRSESEFELFKKTQFPNWEEANKYYNGYREQEVTAIKDRNAVSMFKKIVSNPSYEGGTGTGYFNDAKAAVRNWKDMLVSSGIIDANNPLGKMVDNATTSVPLREAVQAITNQLVISSLGGLGSGRSDSDRITQSMTVPGIFLSKEGSKILADFMQQKNDNAEAIGQKLRDYRRQRGHNMRPEDIDQIARDYADSHPILVDKSGKPTDLGKRLETLEAAGNEGRATTGGFLSQGLQTINDMGFGSRGTPPPSARRIGGTTSGGIQWSVD